MTDNRMRKGVLHLDARYLSNTDIYIQNKSYLKIVWRVQNLEKCNCGVSFFLFNIQLCLPYDHGK